MKDAHKQLYCEIKTPTGKQIVKQENCPTCKANEPAALRVLLRRAADELQSYCESVNGDMNDALAMEIYKTLGD